MVLDSVSSGFLSRITHYTLVITDNDTFYTVVYNGNGADEGDVPVDSARYRDGTEVTIGTQVWTVENLRTTKYDDGTPITLDTSAVTWGNATTEMFCYYNNTVNSDTIKKWGALYNWYVVSLTNPMKIAPAGWHVPTKAEWTTVQNYLIANRYYWDSTTTGNKIAKAMAAKTDWLASTNSGAIGNDMSTNNRSGFSALPDRLKKRASVIEKLKIMKSRM